MCVGTPTSGVGREGRRSDSVTRSVHVLTLARVSVFKYLCRRSYGVLRRGWV